VRIASATSAVSISWRESASAPETRGTLHTTAEDPAIAEEAWERGVAYAQKGHDVDRYGVIARHIVTAVEGDEQ